MKLIEPSLFILVHIFSRIIRRVLLKALDNPFVASWYTEDNFPLYDTWHIFYNDVLLNG